MPHQSHPRLLEALCCFGRRAVGLASTAAARPLVPAAAAAWTSPSLGATAIQLQAQALAKAKKRKGGKGKASAPSAAEDDDYEVGDEEDGRVNKALQKAKKKMNGAVIDSTRALSLMRPGRAGAGIFDDLHVQAYGQHVPLAQVVQIAAVGTHALSVSVYDSSLVQEVKKAIETTNLVYSVHEDVSSLEISFPKMSMETRAELLKTTKKQAGQARQHVRRVRQVAMNHAPAVLMFIVDTDLLRRGYLTQLVAGNSLSGEQPKPMGMLQYFKVVLTDLNVLVMVAQYAAYFRT